MAVSTSDSEAFAELVKALYCSFILANAPWRLSLSSGLRLSPRSARKSSTERMASATPSPLVRRSFCTSCSQRNSNTELNVRLNTQTKHLSFYRWLEWESGEFPTFSLFCFSCRTLTSPDSAPAFWLASKLAAPANHMVRPSSFWEHSAFCCWTTWEQRRWTDGRKKMKRLTEKKDPARNHCG